MNTTSRPITRRRFLQSTAKAVATFTILRAGSARTYAANERLNIAAIGISGQGGSDIEQLKSQNIVALCDVDWRHAAGTFRSASKHSSEIRPTVNRRRGGVLSATMRALLKQ